LISRAVDEAATIAVAAGADENTFYGLGGYGDLLASMALIDRPEVVLGRELANGVGLAEAREKARLRVEAVELVPRVVAFAKLNGVDCPIMNAIAAILDGRVRVGPGGCLGATSEVVAEELTKLGFVPMHLIRARAAAAATGAAASSSSSSSAAEDSSSTSEGGFGYLLSMPIQSLTAERHASLQLQAVNNRARLEAVAKATEKDMWLEDLERLEKAVKGMGVFED
jgi:hypothetical protein